MTTQERKTLYTTVVPQTHEEYLAYQRAYYARNREESRAYYIANRDERLAYQKQYKARLRRQVLDAYGNYCRCCGETNQLFLAVDHVNGGGNAHREQVGGSTAVYLDIIRRNFPDDFRVLCHNCNLGRALNGGVCPHEQAASCEA